MDGTSLQYWIDKNTLKLPCSIGEPCYFINRWCPVPRIEKFEVTGFKITSQGILVLFMLDGQEEFLRLDSDVCFSSDEAQAELSKIK